MSTNPNRATDGWGREDDGRDPAEHDGNTSWLIWVLAIVLLILAGGGFSVYQVRLQQERAAAEAARAEAVLHSELARQAAEKAARAVAEMIPKENPSETAKNLNETKMMESSEKKKFWPGMLLIDRDGKPRIHINSDGRRESGVPGLIGCLKDDDPGIRASAARWLSAIGRPAKDALPELRKALDDADAEVRKAAKIAIKRIETDDDTDE